MKRFIIAVAALALNLANTKASSREPRWEPAEGTRIPVPPAEHPRLYLRTEHAAQLPRRLTHAVLLPAVVRLREQAEKSLQSKVEWNALQYLAIRDASLGRATINVALPLLQKCEIQEIVVSEASGAAWFEGQAGTWILSR